MKFQFFTKDSLLVTVEIGSHDYVVIEDQFGRKWRLTPLTNENIKQPFFLCPII